MAMRQMAEATTDEERIYAIARMKQRAQMGYGWMRKVGRFKASSQYYAAHERMQFPTERQLLQHVQQEPVPAATSVSLVGSVLDFNDVCVMLEPSEEPPISHHRQSSVDDGDDDDAIGIDDDIPNENYYSGLEPELHSEEPPKATEEYDHNYPPLPMHDFKCSGCAQVFMHKGAKSTHEKHCNACKVQCSTCNKTFHSAAALHGHHARGACAMKVSDTPIGPTTQKKRSGSGCIGPSSSKRHKIQKPQQSAAVPIEVSHANAPALSSSVPIRAIAPIEDQTICDAWDVLEPEIQNSRVPRGLTAPNRLVSSSCINGYKTVFVHVFTQLCTLLSHVCTSFISMAHALANPAAMESVLCTLDTASTSAHNTKQKLTKLVVLLSHIEVHVSGEGGSSFVYGESKDLVFLKLAQLNPRLAHERCKKNIQREVSGSADVFAPGPDGVSQSTSILASASVATVQPSLQSRLCFRWENQLRFMELCGSHDADASSLMKYAFVAIADGLVAQRKQTLQYLREGQAESPISNDGDVVVPTSVMDRFFVSFRTRRGAYNITQLQNKIRADYASEVPPELTMVLNEWLMLRHASLGSMPLDKPPVFLNSKGGFLTDGSFRQFEKSAFKGTSTSQNQRHAIGDYLASTLTDTEGPLAQSIASAMNTSVSCIFGKTSSTHHRSKGGGAGAYTPKTTQVANSFDGVMWYRNLVFRSPLDSHVLMLKDGSENEFVIAALLSISPAGCVAAVAMEHDSESNTYRIQSSSLGHGRGTSNEFALPNVHAMMSLALQGTDQLQWVASSRSWQPSWGRHELPPEHVMLNAQMSMCRHGAPEPTRTRVQLQQGQLVLVHGHLHEVRTSTPPKEGHVAVLAYTEIKTSCSSNDGSTTWKLTHDGEIKQVPASLVDHLVDWALHSDGVWIIVRV